VGRDFTKREQEVLTGICEAAQDPTGVHSLILVQTEYEGREVIVLCTYMNDPEAGLGRLMPVALMLTPEEADRLVNPFTGRKGLPWMKDPNQLELDMKGVN
jgi:hypothetical protein